ncbi:MAG TPA: hypothetical protein ENN40_06990 [Candidatus Aminicenantes bacterium]|nr:hypothetical protein [Candidatus Aminicenantes bacterium]
MKNKVIFIAGMIFLYIAVIGYAADKTSDDPVWKLSFSERTRLTTFDNSINLDDGIADTFTFTRHYTSLGLTWTPHGDFSFMVKFANEFRSWLSPKSRRNDLNEIYFDQLYVKWKSPGSGLTLTVGRQNIMLGEGFVCLDGQPLTGSRSAYFNAVRADYVFSKNHSLTAFVSHVPRTDTWLPLINEPEPPQLLEEQANTGIGLYYQGSLGKVGLQAYYFRKDTEANDITTVESGINTLGARAVLPLVDRLSVTAEAALQNGSLGDVDRGAYGGYFHLDWKMAESVPIVRLLTFGGILLSGDDPATADYEGWDPLWSRWPKWSESYIYTFIREGGVARWTNFSAFYFGLNAVFNKDFKARIHYYILGAPQDGPALPSFAGLAGEGQQRGGLLVSRFDYVINPHLSGHFVWEHFEPGSYYVDTADGYNWFRFELMIRY